MGIFYFVRTIGLLSLFVFLKTIVQEVDIARDVLFVDE